MKTLARNIMLSLALLLPAAGMAASAPKGWERLQTERQDTRQIVKETDIEIRTARGVITVTTNHAVQIKIVSILGQTVTSETLQPGTYQFTVRAHGLYIVKAGDLTCKVSL